MCPYDTEWTFQASGEGADKNAYYVGLRIFAPTKSTHSFKEDLAKEINDDTMYYFENNAFAGVTKEGKKYSVVWLPVARYNTELQAWTYFGASSTTKKYIGWDYRVDWYDATGLKTHAQAIRINLANEQCYTSLEQQINITQIIQSEDDTLVLNGGSATSNI